MCVCVCVFVTCGPGTVLGSILTLPMTTLLDRDLRCYAWNLMALLFQFWSSSSSCSYYHWEQLELYLPCLLQLLLQPLIYLCFCLPDVSVCWDCYTQHNCSLLFLFHLLYVLHVG